MKPDDTDYKILIVDDDDAVRDSLLTVLSTVYLNVEGFASGPEFLASVVPAKRNCLVLDIHMPEMTGMDVMQEMTVRNLYFPTILITGRSDSAMRASAKSFGAIALLDKPLDHNRLISAIEEGLLYKS
jgi:two-component system, LuxR family, response regulator FixJ